VRPEMAQARFPWPDEAQLKVGKADQVVAPWELADTEQLTAESFADEDRLPHPFDCTLTPDPAHLVIRVVSGVLQPCRPAPRGRLIERRRSQLSQRLVGTLAVVLGAKAVAPALLLNPIRGRWTRGLRLERAMHAVHGPADGRGGCAPG
jgi:hypothetical protein